jgi:hypothetical protein
MEETRENATGRTSESFDIEIEGDHFRLVGGGDGAAPVSTLEVGFAPHWVPISALIEWAEAKSSRYGVEMPNPWAVQKAIAVNGPQRLSAPVDIYSTLVEECAEDINRLVGAHVNDMIRTNLQTIYG